MGLMELQDRQANREVAEITPAFPIVVVTETDAQIVLGADLDEFKARNPNCSFLVRLDRELEIRDQIEAKTRAANP